MRMCYRGLFTVYSISGQLFVMFVVVTKREMLGTSAGPSHPMKDCALIRAVGCLGYSQLFLKDRSVKPDESSSRGNTSAYN